MAHPDILEELYDSQIAPKLKELGKLCEDSGLSFLAVAEWAPGEYGKTYCQAAEAGLGIRWAEAAIRSNGNADGLIMAMMGYAAKHGHNSICLSKLGVPVRPKIEPASAA